VTAAALGAEPVAGSPVVDDLVVAHLPLVGHIVRELMSRLPTHVSRDDLVSAGTLALVLAARGFDPERGVPFGRFAAIRIRGAIIDELRMMDWAGRGLRSRAREVESVRTMLAARLFRVPSRDEVAQAMGVSVRDLDAVDRDVQRASVLSLQSLPVGDGADVVPTTDDGPDATLLRREELGILRDAIAELPERPRRVIEWYFFDQRKTADIAAELGVTESRVSQLRSEALTLLRAGLRACAGEGVTVATGRGRQRAALRQSYCAAVTRRSDLAQRLRATTVTGEVRPWARVD
jgi:RNA polymerase sigma factor for flagellar operon FliA